MVLQLSLHTKTVESSPVTEEASVDFFNLPLHSIFKYFILLDLVRRLIR